MNIARLLIGVGIGGIGTTAGSAILGTDPVGVRGTDARVSGPLKIAGTALAVGGTLGGAAFGWSSLTPLRQIAQHASGGPEMLGMIAAVGAALVIGTFAGSALHQVISPSPPSHPTQRTQPTQAMPAR